MRPITWQSSWRELDLVLGLVMNEGGGLTLLDPTALAVLPREGVQLADVSVLGSALADRILVGVDSVVNAGEGDDELLNGDSLGGNWLVGGPGVDRFLVRVSGDQLIGGSVLAQAAVTGVLEPLALADRQPDLFLIDSSDPGPVGALHLRDVEPGIDRILLDGVWLQGPWHQIREQLQTLQINSNAAPRFSGAGLGLPLVPGQELLLDLADRALDADGDPLTLLKLEGPDWLSTAGTSLRAQVPSDLSPEQLAALSVRLALSDGQAVSAPIEPLLRLQQAPIEVTSVRHLASGVVLQLSSTPDLNRLNLVDGSDATQDRPDLRLIGPQGQPLDRLSLHWDAAASELYLLRSDSLTGLAASPFRADRLTAGDYSLQIDSRSDGLVSAATGELLDGNRDGLTGDVYILSFNRQSEEHLIAVADTVRGPAQPLGLNGVAQVNGVQGLPVLLSTTAATTSLRGLVSVDPAVIQQATLLPGADLPADWSLAFTVTTTGTIQYSLSGSTPISGRDLQLFRCGGVLSPSAGYGSTTLVQVSVTSLAHPDLVFARDPGLVAVVFSGDTTGQGAIEPARPYAAGAAALIQRVVVGLDSGFDAYPSLSPVLIGDTTGNGGLSSLDASLLLQQQAGLPVITFPQPLPSSL